MIRELVLSFSKSICMQKLICYCLPVDDNGKTEIGSEKNGLLFQKDFRILESHREGSGLRSK